MARSVKAFGALVVVLTASAAWAQPGGGRGFFGGPGRQQSGVMLLGIDEVRTELATTSEQNTKLEDLGRDVRAKAQDAFGDFQNQSEAERAESRKKLDEINKEADAKLAGILKPEQLDRLNQLKLQREGATAIARPEVADKLGLTKEQKDQAAKIVETYNSQGNQRNFGDLSDEERQKYFAERQQQREKVQGELLALLNADQKTKWEQMQGKKFTFPERGGRNR